MRRLERGNAGRVAKLQPAHYKLPIAQTAFSRAHIRTIKGMSSMRTLTLTACVVLLAAADGSALAASACGKGMLWPYVRQPGDCLTDDEIRAGQQGVYNGPVNTNPDLSGIRVQAPAQSNGVTATVSPAPGTPAPAAAAAPAVTTPAAAAPGTPQAVVAPTPSGPPLNGAGFTPGPRANATDCKKGWLWPFVRDPGDCLTDAERQNGQAGVYRAEQVVASAAPVAAAPGVTPVSASVPANAGSPPASQPVSQVPVEAAPACRKGWLWPFVRRPGDCPTDAERRSR
jgi:hypothetical protein